MTTNNPNETRDELGPEPTTVGQKRVVIRDHGSYKVYESVAEQHDELPDPPTSERAKAHGLRRIKRRHFERKHDD